MLFSKRRIESTFIQWRIDSTPFERKTEARFLGVIADEKLTWTSHIKAVKQKCHNTLAWCTKSSTWFLQRHVFRFSSDKPHFRSSAFCKRPIMAIMDQNMQITCPSLPRAFFQLTPTRKLQKECYSSYSPADPKTTGRIFSILIYQDYGHQHA